VQRTEGRRRLHRLALLGGAVAVVAGLGWLTTTPLLDVDTIRVEGADHTTPRAVRAALHIRRGDPLLTANISGASRSLSHLPWVATAKVRRSWPGTVAVSIVERTPVAAVAAKRGGWVLVDAGGRQLDVAREPAVELVRVAGLPLVPAPGVLAGPAYDGALALSAAIPKTLRGSIQSLWPKRDGSVDAIAVVPGGGEATVRFGSAAQLDTKLVALASVLERADLAGVRTIDLRVPNAPALTRG
jgi:cell division protein FtsQ